MSLEDLQKTIDASIAGASAFTRGLFESNHWTAQQLQDYANEDASMTVATVDKDGKPHAAVVIAGCVDGTFYFTASPKSALLGNLRRNPLISPSRSRTRLWDEARRSWRDAATQWSASAPRPASLCAT